jgi:NAD(P)H-flavin reductase
MRQDSIAIQPVTITAIQNETPGVKTYAMVHRDAAVAGGFASQPGQFNMLYVPGVGEAAISLSGDAAVNNPLIHTIRAVGNVTIELSRAAVGASLGIRGPFGTPWPIATSAGNHIVLVAGGIGLAPLRPVIYHLLSNRDRYREVHLLIGARSPADLLYAAEYATWQQGGIAIQTTVDRAGPDYPGHIGVVTLLLQRLKLVAPAQTVLMTCGPEVMMNYAIREALRGGLAAESIWLSIERNMNCAIGHCGHCQFGPFFACTDGPVMRYDRIAPLLEVAAL